MISGNIVLCGSDGRFGDFGCQHAVKIARQLPLPQYNS
ncbi:hypothetical protein LTSEWAN_5970, partial [Salmonella enterica subsp. enterica serovar Wandsworth str. A4-580]